MGKDHLAKSCVNHAGEGEDSTENYVIPLTIDNTNLSSVIVAVTVADEYLINSKLGII